MQIDSVLPDLKLIPCTPSWYARTGHLQTIWGHLLSSAPLPQPGEKLDLVLPDGDQLVAFCHAGNSDTVVSIFHGLAGDANADYVRRTALLCMQLGHTCIRVNHRGAGVGVGLAAKPYHSGRSEDISEVLKALKLKYPGKKQIAVGFSMSGNMILHLLSRRGGDVLPDAAIVANAAINLKGASLDLQKGFNRVYDLRFVNLLGSMVKDKVKISSWSTVFEFDQLYTAPASGFRDREHYYSEASSKDHVKNIKTPVYVLTAADDPFVSVNDYLEASWPRHTHLHIEKYGGHMGYVSQRATPLGTHRWMDYYVNEALRSLTGSVLS